MSRRHMNSTGVSGCLGGAALTGDAEADPTRLTRPGEGTPRGVAVCALLALAASAALIVVAYLT